MSGGVTLAVYTPEVATKALVIDDDFPTRCLNLVAIYPPSPYQCQFCCRFCLQCMCNVRCRFFLPRANSVVHITVALFTGCPFFLGLLFGCRFSVAAFTVIRIFSYVRNFYASRVLI